MSQFYASIQGNRGQATRIGTEKSGIEGHIRGWNSGVEVRGCIDETGNDEFEVYMTSGSGYGTSNERIATIKTVEGKPVLCLG